MSNRSRVILYAKKREEISKMGKYSFLGEDDSPKEKEETLIVNHEEVSAADLSKTKPSGIKSTTLSTSLDELIQEQQELDRQNENKEIRQEYHQNREKKKFPWIPLLFTLLGVVILAVVILLVLSFIGGTK